MIYHENETEITKNIRRTFISVSILWLGYLMIGIIVALVSWAAMGYSKEPLIRGISPEFLIQLRNILIAIGVGEIILGLWLKSRFLESAKNKPEEDKAKSSDFFPTITKTYAQAHLIPSALAIGPAFYGLILGFMGADKNSVILLFIISFFGLWLFQPRIKQLRALVSQFQSYQE